MAEREGTSFGGRFFERFDVLQETQAELAKAGYFLHPVPREHTEGLITDPLLHRLRTEIKKRGFAHVAGHVAITFSGYSQDVREIYEIPEVRAYWRALDSQLPELPALLTTLPMFGFNGPGMQLMLLGTIDAVIRHDAERRYDLHVVEGPDLIADAVARIRQAGRKYHLPEPAVATLIERFNAGAGAG